MMKLILNKTAQENLRLCLFCKFNEPTEETSASSMNEASGGGYAPYIFVPADWTITIDGDGRTVAEHPQVTFLFTGPTTAPIYGWFIQGVTSALIYAVEVFDPDEISGINEIPVVISFAGQKIRITPRIYWGGDDI